MDATQGIQKAHTSPTPRIGGIAIFAGVITAMVFTQNEIKKIISIIIIAGLPAFIFGLAEDFTKKINVLTRLIATITSGVIAWMISGYSINSVGVPIIDIILSWLPISVAFTAFAVGGVANAINIIDGFNGLASGFAIVALNSLAIISYLNGDINLSVVIIIIATSILGFWFINWPHGKIFLGDGGSYFIGFSLAWVSIMLVNRNQSISAFTPLLILIHPVFEVIFSIYRRSRKRKNPGSPDRLHLHSLIMKRYVAKKLMKIYKNRQKMIENRNAATGLLMIIMNIPNALLAIYVAKEKWMSMVSCIVFIMGYIIMYRKLIRFR